MDPKTIYPNVKLIDALTTKSPLISDISKLIDRYLDYSVDYKENKTQFMIDLKSVYFVRRNGKLEKRYLGINYDDHTRDDLAWYCDINQVREYYG